MAATNTEDLDNMVIKLIDLEYIIIAGLLGHRIEISTSKGSSLAFVMPLDNWLIKKGMKVTSQIRKFHAEFSLCLSDLGLLENYCDLFANPSIFNHALSNNPSLKRRDTGLPLAIVQPDVLLSVTSLLADENKSAKLHAFLLANPGVYEFLAKPELDSQFSLLNTLNSQWKDFNRSRFNENRRQALADQRRNAETRRQAREAKRRKVLSGTSVATTTTTTTSVDAEPLEPYTRKAGGRLRAKPAKRKRSSPNSPASASS